MPYFNNHKQKYIASVTKQGMRRQGQFKTKKDALAFEAKWTSLPAAKWKAETNTVFLIDWCTRYLKYAEARFAAKTFKEEKKAVFARFFKEVRPDLPAAKLTLSMTMAYFENQKKQRSGNASNKDRKNLLAAWNWGCKYIDGFPSKIPNPFETEKMPEQRRPRYIPPVKDFWAVHGLAEGQDNLILTAFLHTAARPNEVLRLKWSDVRFDTREISLSTKKTGDGSSRADRLPMTDELHNALLAHKQLAVNEWVVTNPDTGEPYVDRRRWLKRICREAGVRYFTFYAIRHLTPSILYEAGVAPKTIQEIMRHAKSSTTERYLHRLSDVRSGLRVLDGGNTLASGLASNS